MRLRRTLPLILLIALCPSVKGQDTVSVDFFNQWYHQGNTAHYLEAINDHVIFQDVHVGQWSDADQFIFSVDGNSYRQNRFYLNGFRINSRFQTGSTPYRPNLQRHGMIIDPRTSAISFISDADARDYAAVTFNHGGIGGINRLSEDIVRIMHGSGSDDLYKESALTARQRVRAAGTVDIAKTLTGKDGARYRQHLMMDFSQREFPNYDHNGLIDGKPLYDASSFDLQMDGFLPSGTDLDCLGYLVNVSRKDNYGAEFYLNPDETVKLDTYGASVYAKKGGLTGGVTWTSSLARHRNLEFRRNVIDQDGESLYPYSPDGNTHELSVPVSWRYTIIPGIEWKYDGYNSLILFNPTQTSFSNEVFMRHTGDTFETPLYRYQWESNAFAGGILENTFGIETRYTLTRGLTLGTDLNLTLDGILLKGKSKVSPGVQSEVSFDWQPVRWFRAGLDLSYDRIPYTIETLRYISNDYLNGTAYYDDGRVFETSGGKYHSYADNLHQPTYVTLEIPLQFRFKSASGVHEIMLNQVVRKYSNTWMTSFANGADQEGYWQDGVWYQDCGVKEYVIEDFPDELKGPGFMTRSPFFVSQLTHYTYTGRRFMCMVSWQSMMGAAPTALGFGPETNDFLCLSESTANPNTFAVLQDEDNKYQSWGRVDQDKAYVFRTYFAYNISKAIQCGLNFKWTDGQPFSYFNTFVKTDDAGGTQVQILPASTRGINPIGGSFGCRESGIFNFDLHVRGQWRMSGHDMSLNLMCYNVNDFGNVLIEYAFPEGARGRMSRGHNLALTVPRGLLMTYTLCL